MHRPMHGPACPLTQTPFRPHPTYTERDYMILLLGVFGTTSFFKFYKRLLYINVPTFWIVQVAVAAMDLHRVDVVDECLSELRKAFDVDSFRVRRLMVRWTVLLSLKHFIFHINRGSLFNGWRKKFSQTHLIVSWTIWTKKLHNKPTFMYLKFLLCTLNPRPRMLQCRTFHSLETVFNVGYTKC